MLGFKKLTRSWVWAACGKHPLADDYISVGTSTPFFEAFSDWVEGGYRSMAGSKDQTICSWRFWTRGSDKDSVTCGILKNSSDRIGRPFPLLVMGTGVIRGGDRHERNLIPVLAMIWQQIEYTCSISHTDLETFAAQIADLKAPVADWDTVNGQLQTLVAKNQDEIPVDDDVLSMLENDGYVRIPLDSVPGNDEEQNAAVLYRQLISVAGTAASTVFWGGKPEASEMVIYLRPLVLDDFIRLWLPETMEL
jgi:type VI secretion system ImpM family protein